MLRRVLSRAQLERIRIFLTDQWRSRAKVNDISNEVMLTVEDFYKKPELADNYRKDYGLTFRHTMGLDSGGFQFLMDKLKGVPMETLPCGIDVPVSAQNTIDLYKRTGVESKDLPIQLDLPPRYDLPPEARRQLIERSALYFYEMVPEIRGVVPVIHGWTLEEVEYSLRLVEDPDTLAAGSNIPLYARNKSGPVSAGTNAGARFNWTMGNMNPHESKACVGTFLAPENSVVKYVKPRNPKIRAVGSFKGLNTFDHNDYVVSRGQPKIKAVGTNLGGNTNYIIDHVTSDKPKIIATPAPGRLDLGIDKPFIDKVVATPSPTKMEAGIAPSSPRRKAVAAGSYSATVTGPIGEKLASNKAKEKKKRVPYKVILDRIIMVSEFLGEEYEIFWLGGASPHMQHQLFMLGGKWTDTSAWRIKGVLGEIYLPGRSERSIGYSDKTRKCDDEDLKILKECLQDSTHPVSGMAVSRFLEIGRMNMPEWYLTWNENKWEIEPFKLRCIHNAWALKHMEEAIANDLSQDPDAYYSYLRKRLERDNHPILVKRLDYLAKKSGLKRSGQVNLDIFLKSRKK